MLLGAHDGGPANEYPQHMVLWGNKKTNFLITSLILSYVTNNKYGTINNFHSYREFTYAHLLHHHHENFMHAENTQFLDI